MIIKHRSWISFTPESGKGKKRRLLHLHRPFSLPLWGKGSFEQWHKKLNEMEVTAMRKLTTVVGLVMVSAAPLLAASRQAVTYDVVYENLTPQQTMERAIQRDLAAVANPANGGKMQVAQLTRANAMKALANDQAALEAYKTAGPKMDVARLEGVVRDDQFAIDHWGNGSKLSAMLQSREDATVKLAQDQASLQTLRTE
jgi:hypothetical protein